MNISQTVAVRLRPEINVGFYFYNCVLSFFLNLLFAIHVITLRNQLYIHHEIPPLMSKLANATDLGRSIMPSSVHDENDIPVNDSRLAYIISDVISKLKLKQSQVNNKRKGLASFHVLLAQQM